MILPGGPAQPPGPAKVSAGLLGEKREDTEGAGPSAQVATNQAVITKQTRVKYWIGLCRDKICAFCRQFVCGAVFKGA